VAKLTRVLTAKGGHTVPNSISRETGLTPAISRNGFITIDATTSRRILESTRKHKVTFGEGQRDTMLPWLAYRLRLTDLFVCISRPQFSLF
jgi:hypothetical protein